MFTLLKERFFSILETQVAHETFLINTNPIIMKKLCERNPKYLQYVKGKSITPEIIETALERVIDVDNFILNYILYQGNDIEHSSIAMEYFCKLNGTFFTSSRGSATTFKNFLIAINHPDYYKRLEPESIIGKHKFYFDHIKEEELKKFCEFDGRFLYSISYKDITLDILKIALNHPDPDKRPNLLKVPAIRHNINTMEKLIELDGQYFIYTLQEAANKDLLNKALNHPDPSKRLSFDRIPSNFNSYFNYYLIKPLIEIDERWIKYVYLDSLPSKGLIKKLKIDRDFIPTIEIIEKFKTDPEVLKTFYEEIEKGHYTLEQISEICSVYLDKKIINDDSFQKITKYLCEKENVDYEFFKKHISKAISLNDEVLKTLRLEFLQERYYKIYKANNYERLYSLITYSDIQDSIIRIGKPLKDGHIDYELGDKKIELLSQILNLPNKYNENKHIRNWVSYYMKVISSFENEIDLYDNIATQIDEIDDILLKKLASYTIGKHQFKINTIEDLKNYDSIRNVWIEENLSLDNLDNVREAVLEKTLGISLLTAKELSIPYTDGVLQGNEFFHKDIVEFFKVLNRIMKEENIDTLKYQLSRYKPKINLKDRYSVDLRGIIKKQYMRAYNKTLFEIKNKKPSDNIQGIKLYKAAGKNGDEPFNISLSVLGAYSGFDPLKEGYNYKEDWLRPKISNHGICTSYIANNNLGVAHTSYSILGFTNYEDEALLLSGPSDIYSVNESFDIIGDEDLKSKYLPPSLMIDSTRTNHNEMVMERQVGHEKRMPSYVVLVCSDYESTKRKYLTNKALGRYLGRKDNLYGKEKNEGDLLHHALETAKDFNIPIVVVERDKISLSEYKKIRQRFNEFRNTTCFNRKEIKEFFYDLIVNYENNYSGNKIYHREVNRRYFSQSQAEGIIEVIKEEIEFHLDKNPTMGLIMLDELEALAQKEIKKQVNIESAFNYEKIIAFCSNSREELLKQTPTLETIFNIYNASFNDESYLKNYTEFIKPLMDTKQISVSNIKKGLTTKTINQLMITINEIYRNSIFDEILDSEIIHIENIMLFSILISKGESLSQEDIDLLLISALLYHIPTENNKLLDKYLIKKYKEEDAEIIKNVIEYQKNKSVQLNNHKTKKIAHILEDSINLDKTRFDVENPNFININLLHSNVSLKLIRFSMQVNECIKENSKISESVTEKQKSKSKISFFKKYIK